METSDIIDIIDFIREDMRLIANYSLAGNTNLACKTSARVITVLESLKAALLYDEHAENMDSAWRSVK